MERAVAHVAAPSRAGSRRRTSAHVGETFRRPLTHPLAWSPAPAPRTRSVSAGRAATSVRRSRTEHKLHQKRAGSEAPRPLVFGTRTTDRSPKYAFTTRRENA